MKDGSRLEPKERISLPFLVFLLIEFINNEN